MLARRICIGDAEERAAAGSCRNRAGSADIVLPFGFGNGGQLRPLICVDDVIEGLDCEEAAVARRIVSRKIGIEFYGFNLGDGHFAVIDARKTVAFEQTERSCVFFRDIPGAAVSILGLSDAVEVHRYSVARRFVALGKADYSEYFIVRKISVLVGKIGKIVGQSLKERVVLLGRERVERDDIREEFVSRLKRGGSRLVDRVDRIIGIETVIKIGFLESLL